MGNVYDQYKNQDGFLYLKYTKEETYGWYQLFNLFNTLVYRYDIYTFLIE